MLVYLRGQICSDSCMCCHTEKEVAHQTFFRTQTPYTDTRPTSPSTDPITPGTWQGSHWSANFYLMTLLGKILLQAGFEPQIFCSWGKHLAERPVWPDVKMFVSPTADLSGLMLRCLPHQQQTWVWFPLSLRLFIQLKPNQWRISQYSCGYPAALYPSQAKPVTYKSVFLWLSCCSLSNSSQTSDV